MLGIDVDAEVLPGDVRRIWLLPILQQNIRNARLGFFVNEILPVAEKLHLRIGSLPPSLAKLYGTVERQLWGLLPAFLKSAADFERVFPKFAAQLLLALIRRPDLRLTVLASIRALAK